MADDAAYVQSITSKLADEGKDILVLTHSYGGIPGTESVKGLSKADREKEGKKGGVVRLLYMTSIVPPVGGCLQTVMEGDNAPPSEVMVRLTAVLFPSLFPPYGKLLIPQTHIILIVH